MLGNIGVYVHVPFCKSKCPYCDFYSVPYNNSINLYIKKVCSELRCWAKNIHKTIDTIYFGGGTPSLVGSSKICEILDEIKKCFVTQNPEITVEINPADCSFVDFECLKKAGVNRLSIGAQSLNNNELEALGRRHNAEEVASTVVKSQKAGFDNISLDLILGISGQTQSTLEKSLVFCKENNIPHISAYILKIEKNTQYFKLQKTLNLPNEDKTADLFLFTCETLEKLGYDHYEISNFAIPGCESRNNLKYWNLEEYLGVGPSAHSLINGSRFYYKNSISDFLNGGSILNDGIGGTEEEYAMLQLRLVNGLENKKYKEKFNCSIPEKYYAKLRKYSDNGLVLLNKNSIKLTKIGFLMSNVIISDILY